MDLMELQIDVIVDHSCTLGEGVIWDERCKTVSWVDIEKGEIHEYSIIKKKHRVVQVYQKIGSIALCKDGNYIAAVQNGIGIIDRVGGEIKIIADPESHISNNRFNDGKCDPAGRFWAGTMSLSEEAKAGSVYALGEGLSIKKKIKHVTVSNGMAWDTEGHIFYYIDTPTFTVVAYDYDITTGHITNKRIAIRIPRDEGAPDGMTIDNEGMLWIAHWDGWQVARWDPQKGTKLCSVRLPVSRVTSCTFGGDNMNCIFITSAKIGLNKNDMIKQPLAGSLFVVHNCNYKGLPDFKFNEW